MFYSLIVLCLIPVIGCVSVSFKECGASSEYLRVDALDIKPYPIKYPGNVEFSPTYEVLKDIPSEDAKFTVSVDKLTPKRMHIPCIKNFGSCTVNYCEDYDNNFLLTAFGFGKCPMTKGKYSVRHPSATLPNFGSIFDKIMEGEYEWNVTFYNGKTNLMYSCLQFKLSIELNK